MNVYGIIYKAVNNINGKVYIGQTVHTLELRIKKHVRSGHCLYNAIKKYGIDNFTWKIIEHCDSKEELDEMEFHYIKQYNSLSPNGYNLVSGYGFYDVADEVKIRSLKNRKSICGVNNPFYGKKHTPESKHKMSNSALTTSKHANRGKHLTPEWKEKIRLSNIGRIVSKEQREKMSKVRIGKFAGPESKMSKKYVIETPEGVSFFITGLYSFSKHYKNNLLDFRLLSAVAVGKRNHHKGYKCRFYDSELDSNIKEFIYHKDT
jgi:group I intron endonuclease